VAVALPPHVEILFWDVVPADVDLEAHADYVIERIMSRGTRQAMRWLRDTYSRDRLARFVMDHGDRLSPRDDAYWSLITGVVRPARRGGGRPPWAG
jgi:hypothetical protein